MLPTPAIPRGRRRRRVRGRVWIVVAAVAVILIGIDPPASGQRRWVVAFANLTEEPGVTLEGTGFTGPEVRESFTLAARPHPVDLVFYDNRRDDVRAVENAEAAATKRATFFVNMTVPKAVGLTGNFVAIDAIQ